MGQYRPWYKFKKAPFVISPRDIQQHGLIIGLSGFGKSKHIAHLVLELHRTGHAVIVIDPHGDLSREILQHLIARGAFNSLEGFNRIAYLDLPRAAREDRYMPFNVLDQAAAPDDIADNVLDACHRAWPELSQGAANFDQLLPDCVMLLVKHKLPFTLLWRILTNQDFRESLLAGERDHYLVESFRDLYSQLKKPDQVQYAGSLLRRARQLTRSRVLRYGLEQPEMLLDFGRIMERQVTAIINIALPNKDARVLLGCFLMVAAEQAALARERIPEEERRSVHLVVDEAPTFIDKAEDSFKAMLSQARKYKLRLWMALQNWAQMPEALRGAVQNAGVNISFAVGVDDAPYQARLMGRIDPHKVKHEVSDPHAKERTHPTFASHQEQLDLQAQALRDQWPQEATVSYNCPTRWRKRLHLPLRRTERIKTQHLGSPQVDPEKLAYVENWYLKRCFRSEEEIERQLRDVSGLGQAQAPEIRRQQRVALGAFEPGGQG